MDNIILSSWALLLLSVTAVTSQTSPGYNHIYLGYISPYQFLEEFGKNVDKYVYKPLRLRRSPMTYGHHGMPRYDQPAMPHAMPDAMPDAMPYSFDYNSMLYPNPMYNFPFRFPDYVFNPMSFGPSMHFPYSPKKTPAGSYNSGYNPRYSRSEPYGNAFNRLHGSSKFGPTSFPDFSDHFMKTMGFNMDKLQTPSPYDVKGSTATLSPPAASSGQQGQGHTGHNTGDYAVPNTGGQGYGQSHGQGHSSGYKPTHSFPGSGGFGQMPDGAKSYEMSYSKSYSMNMDNTDGKVHMMTKDSSFLNENGQVSGHASPERHYYFNANQNH